MAKINLNKFVGTLKNEQYELEGFELEFSPDEIPAILKAAMPILGMVKDTNEKGINAEMGKLCDEVNELRRKLSDVESENRALASKNEYLNKRNEERKLQKEKEMFKQGLMDAGLREAQIEAMLIERYGKC